MRLTLSERNGRRWFTRLNFLFSHSYNCCDAFEIQSIYMQIISNIEWVFRESVFPLVMWTNSVLSVTQLGRDHSSSIIIHHSAFKQFSLLGCGTAQFCFFRCNKRFSLLGCGTDQFWLFRCNNVEFSVQMGNGSVCWDVERMSFVFFDVTTPSSLFRWETVQSVGMWNGSVLSFSM